MTQEYTENLFPEFSNQTLVNWEALLAKDLKGKLTATDLQVKVHDGVTQSPFEVSVEMGGHKPATWQEDLHQFLIQNHKPTTGRFILNVETSGIDKHLLALAQNRAEKQYLIWFSTEIERPDLSWLYGFNIREVDICFVCRNTQQALHICETLKSKFSSVSALKGSLYIDAIEFDDSVLSEISTFFIGNDSFKYIGINGTIAEAAGLDVVQQVVYILKRLDQLLLAVSGTKTIDKDESNALGINYSQKLEVSLSAGTHYLLEIAKIRALQVCIQQLLVRIGYDNVFVPLLGLTGLRQYTTQDEDTNLIRHCIEVMAMLNGGCRNVAINNHMLDVNYGSYHLANNIFEVLKQEAGLTEAIDPTAGSYTIEALTEKIANAAFESYLAYEGSAKEYLKSKSVSASEKLIGFNLFNKQETSPIKETKSDIIFANKFPFCGLFGNDSMGLAMPQSFIQ